jgi:hypothetical protein
MILLISASWVARIIDRHEPLAAGLIQCLNTGPVRCTNWSHQSCSFKFHHLWPPSFLLYCWEFVFILLLLLFGIYLILGIEPVTLHMLSTCSTTELPHPQQYLIKKNLIITGCGGTHLQFQHSGGEGGSIWSSTPAWAL